MKVYAVIDTNLCFPSMGFRSWYGWSRLLLEGVFPCFDEIMAEYENGLRRKKFPFKEQDIQVVTEGLRTKGIFLDSEKVEEIFPDPKDRYTL